MPNTNRPFGLVATRHLDGTPYNGPLKMYLFDSSAACYLGDPVKLGGSAGAAGVTVNGIDCEGMPNADVAAAGDVLLGVVVGFLPLQSDLSVLHKLANTTKRIGLVVAQPNVVFEAQEDGVGAPLAAADVGENVDIVYAAGNATSGISGVMLDSSTHATTAAQLRVLGLVKRSDNALGDKAKWEVMINEHVHKSTTGT